MAKGVVRYFRKKPVTVEAMQITDATSVLDIEEWIDSATISFNTDPPTIWIDTMEGRMEGRQGDWIIKGVNGEFYPCKNEIFIKTYQEV